MINRTEQLRFHVKQILKRLWYTLFTDHPYSYVSRIIIPILPNSYLSHLEDNFFCGKGPQGKISIIVREETNRRYYSKTDNQIRKLNREKFWGAKSGKKWHDAKKELYKDENKFEQYLKFKSPLVKQISELCYSSRFKTICEIGTGTGMFLDYLSNQLSMVNEFIGIDLNKEQILENQQNYNNPKLKFIKTEIAEFVNKSCGNSTIFVACGVFEYFTQNELEELFQLISKKVKPAAIAISEPINLDLKNDFLSKPRGNIAYSHNYPYLMKKYNYHIFQKEVLHINPVIPFYDLVIMVGTNFYAYKQPQKKEA